MTRVSVSSPSEAMMPGRNGGVLRRGGGRPKVHDDVVKRIREALLTDELEERIGIVDTLLALARSGDMKAIDTCLAYGIGKPTERVDMDITMTTITQSMDDHEREVLASVIRAAIEEADAVTA